MNTQEELERALKEATENLTRASKAYELADHELRNGPRFMAPARIRGSKRCTATVERLCTGWHRCDLAKEHADEHWNDDEGDGFTWSKDHGSPGMAAAAAGAADVHEQFAAIQDLIKNEFQDLDVARAKATHDLRRMADALEAMRDDRKKTARPGRLPLAFSIVVSPHSLPNPIHICATWIDLIPKRLIVHPGNGRGLVLEGLQIGSRSYLPAGSSPIPLFLFEGRITSTPDPIDWSLPAVTPGHPQQGGKPLVMHVRNTSDAPLEFSGVWLCETAGESP